MLSTKQTFMPMLVAFSMELLAISCMDNCDVSAASSNCWACGCMSSHLRRHATLMNKNTHDK